MSRPIPRRASLAHAVDTNEYTVRTPSRLLPDTKPTKRRGRRAGWVFVAVGVLIMAVLLYLAQTRVVPWFVNVRDGMEFGYPRTSHADCVVGHSDSPTNPTHFVAVNLHRRVLVVEFAGGNPGRATVYTGPFVDSDLTPITVSCLDENEDGKLDLVVDVGGTPVVYFNTGRTFVEGHP